MNIFGTVDNGADHNHIVPGVLRSSPGAFSSKLNMEKHVIESMLRALKPALKDSDKARRALERFWTYKLALIWTVQDVHTAANEREIALTHQEAVRVLQELQRYYNKQDGVQWENLGDTVEGFGLGRKMTKPEVKRFISRNILTIVK